MSTIIKKIFDKIEKELNRYEADSCQYNAIYALTEEIWDEDNPREILVVIESHLDGYEEKSPEWVAIYELLGKINTIILGKRGEKR